MLCDVDDLVLESVALGGWVSGMANAVPKESVELLKLAVNGEYDKARALYRVLIDLFHLDTHVKLVQYINIKLAENITAGYVEYVKAPRLVLEGRGASAHHRDRRKGAGDRAGARAMKSTFFCIDRHTCGNPVRVVANGAPPLHGANMTERRAHFLREYDWIRTALMFEPRGYEVMSGSIPLSADARRLRFRDPSLSK